MFRNIVDTYIAFYQLPYVMDALFFLLIVGGWITLGAGLAKFVQWHYDRRHLRH